MNQQERLQNPDEVNQSYYNEYCRLFIANVVLTTQMKELQSERSELLSKIHKLELKSQELMNSFDGNETQEDKKKRFRRTATDIDRHYKCPLQECQKSYGSEGSLNQHIKLKHPDYYQIHLAGISEIGQNEQQEFLSMSDMDDPQQI